MCRPSAALPRVVLHLSFLSLAHHISPTWWMCTTWGGAQKIWAWETGAGMGRASALWPRVLCSLETDLCPWQVRDQKPCREPCCWARRRPVSSGVWLFASHLVTRVSPSYVYIQGACLEQFSEAGRRWKSESYLMDTSDFYFDLESDPG